MRAPPETAVEVIGGADIDAAISDLPHLRAIYLGTSPFAAWDEEWKEHPRRYRLESPIPLIGRESDLATLESHLLNPEIRAIILCGPRSIGKTRLILEATKGQGLCTVFARDPERVTGETLRSVIRTGIESTVVIDGDDGQQNDRLVNAVLVMDQVKLVIMTRSAASSPAITFGSDPRIRIVNLKPISEVESYNLLAELPGRIDYSLSTFIVSKFGGMPGMLLEASFDAPRFRDSQDAIEEFESSAEAVARRILDENDIDALVALSTLDGVSLRTSELNDLSTVCDLAGHARPNDVLARYEKLRDSGFIRLQDGFAYVTPTALANRLAQRAILGQGVSLVDFFGRLSNGARVRFARRLSQLRGSDPQRFWEELIGRTGLFDSLEIAAGTGEIFRIVASVFPERAGEFLESRLRALSIVLYVSDASSLTQ